eukprot:TRINITY_DN2250_c0_g1_i1.p1 TRINITY_DN2250_c0_g1~~TRINITY_DN2250_c0_g1_i1.p1  ORF type:complete len:185 (+),score=6.00 TRINITY_DN2250_c0_g1_i1:449-1003(+)
MITRIRIPKLLRVPIFSIYSRYFEVKLHEINEPLSSYSTFNAFFTRKLKPEVRPIARPFDLKSLVSPCDAKVLACGRVEKGKVYCVKGHTYSVGELLLGHRGKKLRAEDIFHTAENSDQAVYYVVFYLSPADYHRFHSPGHIKLESRWHIPGYLNPVRPSYLLTHVVSVTTKQNISQGQRIMKE